MSEFDHYLLFRIRKPAEKAAALSGKTSTWCLDETLALLASVKDGERFINECQLHRILRVLLLV